MLEGFSGGAATDEMAQGFQFRGVQLPLKLQIKAETRE
jgi:hypothetical protein